MKVESIEVDNFRLLSHVAVELESEATVIVGRNNSGKTSLCEIIDRFLADGRARDFQLADFSHSGCGKFIEALEARNQGQTSQAIRALVPSIELRFDISYDPDADDTAILEDFIIDLDPDCNRTIIRLSYELGDGKLEALLAGMPTEPLDEQLRSSFFRALRERVPELFEVKAFAIDPTDSTNTNQVKAASVRRLLRTKLINAQRGLDDNTAQDTDVLARVLEVLFRTAASPNADDADRLIASELQEAVKEIQEKLDADFNSKLKELYPTFETLGYPNLGGAAIQTETTLDVGKLLSNHTKVRYAGHLGITLPETYNGLGARNLLYILLQIVGVYKAFRAESPAPGLQLIFVEEPEAHLHPQMQEVFIRKLASVISGLEGEGQLHSTWPVQFIISTHSSHIANEVSFEAIRYFVTSSGDGGERATRVKDLRKPWHEDGNERKFLHQYLTLTRCDLFFADKAILFEGTSERLLLPVIIEKLDAENAVSRHLSKQYVTLLEVGGAYAHLFFNLLRFLELPSLIITDLDSVIEAGGVKCMVHEGAVSSNACINDWFGQGKTIANLLAMPVGAKVKDHLRIAYQIPEAGEAECGRSFEDAFLLANVEKFGIVGGSASERAAAAYDKAANVKKAEFALKYAIQETDWAAPAYIVEGLRWLAQFDSAQSHEGQHFDTIAATNQPTDQVA